MPPDVNQDDMDYLQSTESSFATVSKALSPRPEMAWTVSDAYSVDTRIVNLDCNMVGRVEGKSLIFHSAALSRLIRDIINVYPGQNLTGDALVFREPYAALLHHMSDIETAYMVMTSEEENSTTEHIQLSHALATLLDFLRPIYQECYVPAQMRLSQEQPTVTFDDLWILLRPNSLAYAEIDGHWIGCKVGPSVKWPADSTQRVPARWQVGIWYLQTDFSTEEIGCAAKDLEICDYDGELSPAELKIIPCQFYDHIDGGSRRKALGESGQKILDILWGSARHYKHSGRSLWADGVYRSQYPGSQWPGLRYTVPTMLQFTGDVLIAGTGDLNAVESCIWLPKWFSPSHVLPKEDPAYDALVRKIDPKTDGCDLFTEIMRIMLSPCLQVISLWKAKPYVVHVDNLQSPNFPEFLPEPILHHNQLHNIISLAERQGAHGSVLRGNSNDSNDGSIIIYFNGGIGVGKTYTANYVSWKAGRPLISISVHDFHDVYEIEEQEQVLTQISKTHNAMILIRLSIEPHVAAKILQILIRFLRRLNTVVFVISQTSHMQPPFLASVQMVVDFTPLDYKRQKKMWLHMMDIYRNRREMKIVVDFEKGASIFLSSADMPKVDWNGHDIMKCLRVAVLSAQAAWNSTHVQKDDNRIVVKIEHLKYAMNMAFASRSAASDSIARGGKSVAIPPGRLGVAKKVPRISTGHFDDDSSDDLLLDFGYFHDYDELSDDDESLSLSPKERRKTKLGLSNVRSRKLCIATLNEVEWSTFKTLGTTELFRSKRFYAIDVLVGEPQIWREFPSILGHKRRIPTQDLSAPRPIAAETTRQQNASDSAANSALPERIRVNSPAIIKAFMELRIDDSSNLRGSFLLFRPYKVLSYYEKELRDWTEKLEETAKANREQSERVDEDQDEDLQADVAEMKCLLSFIDTYLKEREERIKSAVVQAVTFDDLWFLFKPGFTVVRNDIPQAYRVGRVATTRHHIKQHTNTSLSFFRDDALVEFDQRHIFIQCVHVDFDGRMLGPVLDIFPIAYFKGERAISSLPIYPIEFSKHPETSKEFLIKRGRAFAKAGTIGHMHYKGLTLPAIESSRLRDEVDSQVVIDFEEAFNRFPEWMPPVKATVLEEGQEESDKDDSSVSSASDEDEWKPEFRDTQDRSHWKCIPECCSRETVYHDESIDDRTRNDYLTSQANENTTAPSVAIEARTLSNSNDTLRDDDFLIMSYRVFGFVLRSRKWHQLDLADASPAETNSDGFDQLVLPKGHKDIVTSMITKHFRDRKSSSSRGQTDIVRGKGRGLIMLLHGVPGVGKTSTAECLAGVFNRPLFQITSGDLGITAKDVDENLEENFSLANRWNCILLIDEADVFLAQRNKEDFVQNSLVAVFLRIMEYYSGVLFLTTNRVGVFDEAFSSRIHISLYYPPLDRDQTLEIFKKNWERILARSEEDGRQIDIDLSEIIQFAMDYFDNNKQGRWNGRQIRNAFQSALAMAEFEVLDMDGVKDDQNDVSSGREAVQTVKLGKKHFEEVAKAYKGFVDYLKKVHGAGSSRRARENMWRFDDDDESAPKRPTALTQRLKFTGDPTQEPPRNVAPSFGPSQYYRGYGPGHETPSHYGPMNPPRGGYAGSHEYHYPPAAFVPRTHEMEQGLYPDHHRASGPSVNYPPAQPQTYGTRTHPAPPQHDMQTSQSNWASSSRDAQSGGYSYHRGEQNLGGGAGPNVRWGDDTEAGGSQQRP